MEKTFLKLQSSLAAREHSSRASCNVLNYAADGQESCVRQFSTLTSESYDGHGIASDKHHLRVLLDRL